MKAFMAGVLELTFRKQKLYSAQVALAGSYHEQGPALLVTDVYISTMLQQQLCNLIYIKKHTHTNRYYKTRFGATTSHSALRIVEV